MEWNEVRSLVLEVAEKLQAYAGELRAPIMHSSRDIPDDALEVICDDYRFSAVFRF